MKGGGMSVRITQKTKKEEGMKKIVVLMLALCLAIPAISYAGTATSRWDLVIGGNIKFDVGYVDQNANSNYNASRRKSDRSDYQHGNFFMNGSESGLNFFVRGPDAWGAKTSAFIAMDFTGQWAKNGTNQQPTMTIGKLQFDWPNTSLSIGVQPQPIGQLPTFAGNTLGWGNNNEFDKGFPSVPQVVLTQRFAKVWSASIGAIQLSPPPAWNSSAASANDGWTRATYPGVEGAFGYSSDACGRIGPWTLTARIGGLYAREWHDVPGTDSYGDGWLADFTLLVPIIPEKNGDKTGALMFDGIAFTTQNSGVMMPAPAGAGSTGDVGGISGAWIGSYPRNGDWKAPVTSGYIVHGTYYFTDALYTNVWFGQAWANMSKSLMNGAGAIGVQNNQQLSVNFMYNVNPAIRLGLGWDQMYTRYAQGFGFEKKGTLNAFRSAVWYFF
jgi:hypothetical protein